MARSMAPMVMGSLESRRRELRAKVAASACSHSVLSARKGSVSAARTAKAPNTF